MREQRVSRSKFTGIAGLVIGALVGTAAVVVAGTAFGHRLATDTAKPFLEATHLPPLLTAPGEPVELRYDVFCAPAEETEADGPCSAAGSVFVRAGQLGRFTEIALREARDAADGRFVATVPDAIARSPAGFAYYAVVRSSVNGKSLTLPAAGAAAPQRSMSLDRGVTASLPAHSFGRTRGADRRVVQASWGTALGEVGLENKGKNLPPIGGSSFDVGRDGSIHVLDEANRRLLHWRAGAASPSQVSLPVNGTLADMSVAEDGTIYVLETTHAGGQTGLLRTFDASGAERSAIELAERASQVRVGPAGPVVLQTTSGQWMAAADGGRALSPSAQKVTGRAGRPLDGDREVVVFRAGNEIRAALVGPGLLRRTWRVVSETPLAEIQLAEPLGDGLVVVARTYTELDDEFVVLVLGPRMLEKRFSLDSADWAETAPLSRFRLVGSSLYQLGSTPQGLFVDRIDLEVKR
jgi:hypothetical protein